MDPDICLAELIQNVIDRDYPEAVVRLHALCNWLGHRGAHPNPFRVEKLVSWPHDEETD